MEKMGETIILGALVGDSNIGNVWGKEVETAKAVREVGLVLISKRLETDGQRVKFSSSLLNRKPKVAPRMASFIVMTKSGMAR